MQPHAPNRPDLRSFLISAILIAMVTLGVYARVGSFEFNNFDDPDYVASNETVQRGLTWEGVRWAFTANFMGNWHPLTWLSHMLDCEWFGLNPGAHHWMSVTIHILNCVLLLWVLCRYTGALERSAAVAALFAIHPLHVESVAWIAERKDVLSTLFWIFTMLAYLRYVEKRSAARYAIVLLCLALGLMSKPMVVTLPCVLLLLDYWPLRRVAALRDYSRIVLEKIPLFLLVIASSVVTFIVQRQGGAVGTLEKYSLGGRIGNALVAYVAYLGRTILPDNLSAFYPHPGSWAAWQVVGAALCLAMLTLLAAAFARRAPYLPVAWLWYVGSLVPVIGLVQVGEQAFADRYTYVPLIGVFIAAVWALGDLAVRFKWPELAMRGGTIVLLLVYAGIAAAQVRHWENSETLFRHAVAVTKDNYLAHYNLGQTLSVSGRIHEAVEHYYATLRLKPDHEGAHNNLGLTYALQGQWQQATNHYAEALKSNPKGAEAHFNMAIAQLTLGNRTNGIEHLRLALRYRPDYPQARQYLADALANGNAPEAIQPDREPAP